MNTVHGIQQYWRSTLFFSASAVFLTAVAVGTDGHAEDGTPQPRPSSTPTQSPEPTLTPSQTPKALPSPSPVTLPPVTLPPSTVVATPTVIVVPTPPAPTPSATPTPSPSVAPHNKAHGLKDGCLVQKKKWIIVHPCPKSEATP